MESYDLWHASTLACLQCPKNVKTAVPSRTPQRYFAPGDTNVFTGPCWTGTDRPGMLFDRAVAWLITNKVLLPGATVLERQVARIRNRAQARVWSLLVQGISAETAAKLEALLQIPDGGHVSMLDRLRKGPFLRSAPELVRAFRRVDAVGLPVAMERKVTLSAKSQCKCRSCCLEYQRLKGGADERRRLDACRLLY